RLADSGEAWQGGSRSATAAPPSSPRRRRRIGAGLKQAEELAARREHDRRTRLRQRPAIGLQHAVELEEVGVAVVGFGSYPVRLGFALAAGDRAALVSLSQHGRALAIGGGLDCLR